MSGTTVTFVTVGTCTITPNQAGDANWNPAPQIAQGFAVSTAVLTVTPDAQSRTYGQTAPLYTFSVTGFAPGENAANAAGYVAPSCTSAYTVSTPVASSPLTISCAGGSATDYTFDTSATAQLTIARADQLITFGALANKTYGDPDFSVGATASSGLAVTFTSATPAVCSVTGTTVHLVAAGGCTIRANQAGDANWNPAPQIAQGFAVSTAVLTVTPDAQSRTYGQTAPLYTFSVTGFAPGENAANAAGYVAPSCTSAYTVSTPVASSPLTISCAGGSATDYTFDTSATAQLTIARADATIAVSGWTGPYDGTAHGASGTATGVHDEALAGLDPGSSFTNVPGGTASWTFTDVTGNYNDTSGSVAIVITGVAQAITFPPLPDVTVGAPGFELAATTTSGLPITYTSLTPAVCTVSGTTVTIVSTGTCTIRASQVGDANYAAAEPVTQSFAVLAAAESAPDTDTITPSTGADGSAPIPFPLLVGLLTVGALAALLVLAFQQRRVRRR